MIANLSSQIKAKKWRQFYVGTGRKRPTLRQKCKSKKDVSHHHSTWIQDVNLPLNQLRLGSTDCSLRSHFIILSRCTMAKFNFGAFLVALAVGKTPLLLLLYCHQLHGSRLEMDWLLDSVLLVLGSSSIVAAAVLSYVV